jgi:hypothetical protein
MALTMSEGNAPSVWEVAEALVRESASARDPAERSPESLYARLVMHYLVGHEEVPVDAAAFYAWLTGFRRRHSGR